MHNIRVPPTFLKADKLVNVNTLDVGAKSRKARGAINHLAIVA